MIKAWLIEISINLNYAKEDKILLKISYTEYKVLVLENYPINLHSERKDLEEVFKVYE